MAETNQPIVGPRRRENPWLRRVLLFATVVVLVDALFGDRGLAESLRARGQYAEASAALARVRAENDALRELTNELRYEPRAIEAEARRELGLAKPGEVLFVVRDR